MQSEINGPSEIDSLKQRIIELEVENNKIKAENVELKARVVKLEDKQSQNELIKNLLSISRIWRNFSWGTPAKMIFSC